MAASSPAERRTPVYIEVGAKRVFACALEWPGWCRSGKDEDGALAALAAAAPRYALAAHEAKLTFSSAGGTFEVVERLPGSATTDFGAPGAVPDSDARPLTQEGAQRLVALVAASWKVLDRVVTRAPAELRKGPRGGGRDRDAIVAHVLGADAAYVRKLGLRVAEPAPADTAAIAALRKAITEILGSASDGAPPVEKGWPQRYAARRIAWHALDHAWEIEDRS